MIVGQKIRLRAIEREDIPTFVRCSSGTAGIMTAY